MASQTAFIGVKRGDDVRSGMIYVPLEGFKVKGAIAAVDIGTFAQRDGDIPLLRSVGG